jgi:hypothetical protein
VSQQKISLVSQGVGEVPPCFELVKHFGGKQNHQLSTWDFSWGSPHPPMGHSLVAEEPAVFLPFLLTNERTMM